MRVEWYGQSAFRLSGARGTVVIDPFGDIVGAGGGGACSSTTRRSPAVPGGSGAGHARARRPQRRRGASAASPIGPALDRRAAGLADRRDRRDRLRARRGRGHRAGAEHDLRVRARRSERVAHFGDFGQRALREEQAAAIGAVDLLFLPVGGGPDDRRRHAARRSSTRLSPRWVVPMHYRTPRIGFLEPAEDFLALFSAPDRRSGPAFETESLEHGDDPKVIVPAAP